MPVVERLLVSVNEAQCDALAAALKSKTIPAAREEIRFDGFDLIETGQLLLFVVAICHQTSMPGLPPLEGTVEGRVLRGWDYLLQKWVNVVRSDRRVLKPAFWAAITSDDVRRFFRNDEGQDLLHNVERRAELLRDLGAVMSARAWDSFQQLYDECQGRIATGAPNLLESLSNFKAYGDPVRKKSYFLLSLMRNSGLWTYRDPEQLGAPVDYHEVRGHLRIGTVSVNDEALRSKLLNRLPVTPEEDIAVRSAVFGAIMRLSERTGLHDPESLHYLFWNVFRNYCTREDPNCLGERRETYLPDRYRALAIRNHEAEACPFSTVCLSATAERRLVEHVFDTDYY